MKTKEELNALKEEVEIMNKKLAELTEEELKQVSGGVVGSLSSKKSPLSESGNVAFFAGLPGFP